MSEELNLGGDDYANGYYEPREPDEVDDDEPYDEERNCHTCGGDGCVEEDDWQEPRYGEMVTCWNCKGSGLSKDCWLW